METKFLSINQVSGVKDSYLLLEGTILVFHEKNAGKETALRIPLELISVSEILRFRAALLIKGLFFFAGSLILGATFGNVLSNVMKVEEDSIYHMTSIIIFFIILMTGLILFFVFLVKFFRRSKTVRLTIAPNNGVIEFWKEPKDEKEIDEFLCEIQRRQVFAEESFINPAKSLVGFVDEPSLVRKWFGFTILSCLPVLITKEPILLLLTLLPVTWFFYKNMHFIRQPKEYRQAVKCYFQKDWDHAINYLKRLQERLPDVVHIPSIVLLVTIYVRLNKFDEALAVTSKLSDEFIDLARQMQKDIWQFKRIYERRNETAVSTDNQ